MKKKWRVFKMEIFEDSTKNFWLFVLPEYKNESSAEDICVENGLIDAIDTFYDASVIGNLRVDIRPVTRALREMN